MKTTNVNAMSESESWICHQLCRDFLVIVQWIAVLICWRKQKTLHDLTLSSKDKNLAQ